MTLQLLGIFSIIQIKVKVLCIIVEKLSQINSAAASVRRIDCACGHGKLSDITTKAVCQFRGRIL